MVRRRKGLLPPPRVCRLLRAARTGADGALGQLLDAYRPFLLAVATAEFDPELKAKAGPSDLVQETFIDAQRHFQHFKSGTEEALTAWLHAILMNNLADLRKRYLRAAKRQVRRERPIAASESKQFYQQVLAQDCQSPSSIVISREESTRIEQALKRLPTAYRQVIIMRNHERRSFAEIGNAIDRSPDAVRMLWKRAVRQLQRDLGASDDRQ